MAQPIFTYNGGEFDGISHVNLSDPPHQFDFTLGPELSVAFTARVDQLGQFNHILYFGFSRSHIEDSIYIYTGDGDNNLWFGVDPKCFLKAENAFVCGEEHQYLFTASSEECKLLRDDTLIGGGEPANVASVERPCMLIGQGANHNGERDPFKGAITDICIWDRVVSWEESRPIVAITLHADISANDVFIVTGNDLSGATIVSVEMARDSTIASLRAAVRESFPISSQLQLLLPDGRVLLAADDTSLVTDLFDVGGEKET